MYATLEMDEKRIEVIKVNALVDLVLQIEDLKDTIRRMEGRW